MSSHHTSGTTGRMPHVLRHAAVLVAVFLCLLVWAWWGSRDTNQTQVEGGAPGSIIVIGDSITSLYDNDPGSSRQGWWSIVGHKFDSHVRTFAQPGSGYLRPGLACTGNRFNQRLHALSLHHADMVIVEGGRNDWAQCVDGRYIRAPDDAVRQAVFNYLSDVHTLVSPSTRVLVLGPPWGPLDVSEHDRIAGIIHNAARHFDMQFVPMEGVLNAQLVVDGVHPNLAGSQAIAARVIAAIEHS